MKVVYIYLLAVITLLEADNVDYESVIKDILEEEIDSSNVSNSSEKAGFIPALKYLGQFGYLEDNQNGSLFQMFQDGLEKFQDFFGLAKTGILDPETRNSMSKPRCGLQDRQNPRGKHTKFIDVDINWKPPRSRQKRYTFYHTFFNDFMGFFDTKIRPFQSPSSRWRSVDLTYRVSRYPKRSLTKEKVDQQIGFAFDVWEEHTPLTFSPRQYGPVHIDIRFEDRNHGDGDSFDGVGGVLAHSYYPLYGGDVHFDDDERWVDTPGGRGTHLLHVAAHEFGHALGLPHSSDPSALMAPTIDDNLVYDVALSHDDITAIQNLYGVNKKHVTTVRPTTTRRTTTTRRSRTTTTESSWSWRNILPKKKEPRDKLCEDGRFDAVISGNNQSFVFRGAEYWQVTEDGSRMSGFPRNISSDWPGMPRSPSAGFVWKNGLTFFFKGSRYYRFKGRILDAGYPKRVSQGFSGLPTHLDATLVWPKNGTILAFKRNKVWKFDPSSSPPVSGPWLLKDLSLPSNIEAGFTHTNNYSYIFRQGLYWRISNSHLGPDDASPAYPRQVNKWWFSCS